MKKRVNKEYIRYDGNGRMVNNIFSRVDPKVGDWVETQSDECCNPTTTTTITTTEEDTTTTTTTIR
jgi:small-conductance mechanosensitive channel